MLQRLLFWLLVSFGWLPRAWAQVYEPGLLVRANGDTLRGEIQNGFWDLPPTFIRYRPTATSPSTLFQPRQLRAVNFTAGRYFRYEALPIDHAAVTELPLLPHGNITEVRVDSVLAEVLLEGPTMLWRVARTGSVHLLVRRPGQPVLDMCERRYLRQNDRGTWVVAEGNNYQAQLGQYFGDCPAAVEAASQAQFTSADLAEVVRAYYGQCAPGQPAARSWLQRATPRRKVAFQGGLLAGGRYNRIESPSYARQGTCTDCGVHPFGGLYAELLQPSRTSAVYGELTLSSFRNEGQQYLGSTNGGISLYSPYSYSALLGSARIGVRFLAPLRHDQHLVFSFGFERNFVFSPQVTAAGSLPAQPPTEELAYAATTLLPNVGVGWRRQRFTVGVDAQLYATYHRENQLLNLFFDSAVSVRLGVSYRLGRNPDVSHTEGLGATE